MKDRGPDLLTRIMDMLRADIDIPITDEQWRSIERAMRQKWGGKHYSVPGMSKKLAEARNIKISKDYKGGVSVPDIMLKYGLSRAGVYKALNKTGNEPA
ncbi:MAG: Mor transcription activator family protein [Gallionella sp.]|jgi:Mor family transcriptional regulator